MYIGWMTIAGILAVNPHLAFWSSFGRGTGLLTWYYSTALALIITSLINRNGIKYLYSLLKLFIFSGFIVAITLWMGTGAFNMQYNFLLIGGGGGITGNSSLAAAYLIFVIFFSAFFLFSKESSQKEKLIFGAIITPIIFSPLFLNLFGFIKGTGVLGEARGAILGIIIGIGITTVCYLALSKNKIIKTLGIVGIIFSIIIFSIGWNQLMTPNTVLHQKFTEVASGTRFLFWGVAQKSIDKHPYFGYGPENYMIAFGENFNPKILNKNLGYESWTDRAHNVYFDTGVSGGYVAIVLYFIIIISIFYAIFIVYKKGKILKIQASILWGLLTAYIFQNLFYFDSVLSIMALFILFGVICGMNFVGIEGVKKNKKEKNSNPILKDQSFRTVTSIFLFIFCSISFFYFSILPARKAKIFGTVLNLPINERPNHYKKLLEGAPIGNDWDVSGFAADAYKLYAKDPIGTKNNLEVKRYAEKDIVSFLEYLEEITKTNSTDFRLYLKINHLYNTLIYITDMPNDKVLIEHLSVLLEKARLLAPANPEIYWSIAQLKAWNNDLKGIEQAYIDAINLDPTTPESYLLLLKFEEAVGNKKLYQEILKQAQKNIPDFKIND